MINTNANDRYKDDLGGQSTRPDLVQMINTNANDIYKDDLDGQLTIDY